MPHADTAQIARRMHDGELPPSWLKGDTPYQKAAVIAAVAWHDVKPAEDPEFVSADLTFRENCIAVVESIMADNEPDPTPFALRVAELWKQTDDYAAKHPNTTNKEIAT